MTPIFLLSLPRSGSTLLQRILGAAPEVATTAETWLLLPLVYARRQEGAKAEYWHRLAATALDEFLERIPDGASLYETLTADLARSLYAGSAGPGQRYFVDKTPRYYFIVDELFRMFPDGKFVILWRNPLAVVASLIRTWKGGEWRLEDYVRDLYEGPPALVGAQDRYPDRVHCVCYERLVRDPAAEIEPLCRWIGIEYTPEMLTGFTGTDVRGTMGDKVGIERYETIDPGPADNWRDVFCNPLRVWWARRYLRWLGDERLAAMGYTSDELRRALGRRTSLKELLRDAVLMTRSSRRAAMDPQHWQ